MGSQWRDFQIKGTMFKQMNSCKNVAGYIQERIWKEYDSANSYIGSLSDLNFEKYIANVTYNTLHRKKSFSWWDNRLENISQMVKSSQMVVINDY